MEKRLKLYYTSDTHGHIFPVDYAANVPAACGVLSFAERVKKDGNTLVLDGGDTLQGTPFSQCYQDRTLAGDCLEDGCHPIAAAFNSAGYDYITLGNHDFNYGYDALRDYLTALDARCLCANVEDLRGELGILPEIVHILENGLRVGITGIVTDYVTVWEQPENLKDIRITDAFTAASRAYERLHGRCDICICIYHGGFERDLKDGRLLSETGENIGWKLCSELPFDVVLTGHQHMAVEGVWINGTFGVQCPDGAREYALLEIGTPARPGIDSAEPIKTKSAGAKRLHVSSSLQPVGDCYPEQPYRLLLPFEEQVQRWLDLPVGQLEASILPEEKLAAALCGSRVAALFNQVQMAVTGADISCTSLGNGPVGLATPVTMRGISSACLFANTLVVVEVDEAVIRSSLERCAAYFTLEDGRPAVSEAFLKPKVEHYNYDFYAGISYTFDLRKPTGKRVVNLTLADGTPLGQGSYRLCTSNYRATGTGGYEALGRCPVLWRGSVEVPELTARYISANSPLALPEAGCFQVLF